MSEADPAQAFIARVKGVLLQRLQGTPNHSLRGLPKILGGDHPTRLP